MQVKIFLLTALITFFSTTSSSLAMKMDFKHHMGEIINSYLVIKSDLSSDKTAQVAEESKKIINHAEKIEHLIKTTSHGGEFHKFHSKINIHLLKEFVEKLPGKSIKDIRWNFKPISDVIVKYVDLFGKPMNVKEDKLYTFHCPMYEGGSDWVQAGKTTANPFYGSMMLKCGTLKSESSAKSGSKGMHMQMKSGSHSMPMEGSHSK